MTTFIKGLALLVAVSCLAWISVLWHWRTSAHSPTTNDLLGYLVLLPLAGFGLLLLLRWGWRAAAERREALASAPAGAAAAAPARAEPAAPPPLQLLRAELLCGCADSAMALLDAAQAGKPLPALDGELRGEDGLPVMSVRIAELPLDEVRGRLESLTSKKSGGAADAGEHGSLAPSADSPVHSPADSATDSAADSAAAGAAPPVPADAVPASDGADPPSQADPPAPPLPAHVLRALAALSVPLGKVLQGLQPWWPLFEPGRQPERGVDLLLAWPVAWTPAERALADAWVRGMLASVSLGPIGPARCRVASIAAGGVELLAQAQQRLRDQAREGRHRAIVVASTHSDLDEVAVAALEREGRLFSPATHPKGLMPSEAAAALLLAPHDWPPAPDVPEAPVQLQPAVVLRRDKSIEAAGSVSSQTLTEVLAGAIGLAKVEAAAVAKLVCDADRHSQRGTELFGATLKALPQLDAAEDLYLTASVAGHGNAGALMVVAGAAARAAADKKPCLGLALGDTHWRLALLAVPPTPPSAA